jgi:hypothetical protein
MFFLLFKTRDVSETGFCLHLQVKAYKPERYMLDRRGSAVQHMSLLDRPSGQTNVDISPIWTSAAEIRKPQLRPM